MKSLITPAKKTLFKLKDLELAEHQLGELTEVMNTLQTYEKQELLDALGYLYQYKQEYEKSHQYFLLAQNWYEAGYNWLLMGDERQALLTWQKLKKIRENHWCFALHGMVTATPKAIPTFLQLRNHLEADIQLLFSAGQYSMVSNMLNFADPMADINLESYKFIGRGLFHAGAYTQSGEFLLKGQSLIPYDPEIYFHLGQYYNAIDKAALARRMLQQCLLISPGYTPAKELLDSLPTD